MVGSILDPRHANVRATVELEAYTVSCAGVGDGGGVGSSDGGKVPFHLAYVVRRIPAGHSHRFCIIGIGIG